MSTLYPVSIPPKTLAQPLSSSGSSFVLSDILDWSGTALTTADLGDILYAVFRNTTNTAIEIMKIDTSTIADSAITITARGLRTKGVTDDTEVAANKLDWNANETIVELGSNPPQLYNHFMREGDAESVTGLKTFDKDKLAMKGTSTGVTVISTANASGTDYTATLQAATGTIAYTANITATKLDDFATPDDNTDLNANTTNHGLLLKATAPASGLYNYVGITNGETAYTNKALFDATSPSTQAFGDTAVVGTATVAARRDHKHAMMAAPTRDSLGLDTDDSPQFTAIELGHASDTTLARKEAGQLNIEGKQALTEDNTVTVTNKRITKRVVTATDDATAEIDCDVTDQYQLTAVANNTTFTVTGTPTNGQKLIIRLKDAGAGKTLTWNAVFRAIGVTLPTTTVANKTHYIGCVYNSADSKWDVLAVGAEA